MGVSDQVKKRRKISILLYKHLFNSFLEGNPVTGEGYKAGATDYIQPASINSVNQVINKNRIPPGGYSSGLW